MNIYETIKAARAKIATREQWCTGDYAQDRFGNPQVTESLAACKFCAVGALMVVGADVHEINEANVALSTVARRLYPETTPMSAIVQANDKLGYEAVIRIYDAYLAENAP